MSEACPNIDTKDWKTLVNQVGGEREAYRAFIAHDHKIPYVLQLSEFKKLIGLTSGRYSVAQQIKIAKKIRYFNKKFGTSHFVKFTKYGTGELSTAEVQFNYLPVNKKEQLDRDRRRKMEGYVGFEDYEKSSTVLSPFRRFMSDKELYAMDREEDLGQFTDEGDFVAPSFAPETAERKRGPKFQALIVSREQDKRILYRNLQDLRKKRREATEVKKRQFYIKSIYNVEEQIRSIDKDLENIEKMTRLKQIEKFAEQDMKVLDWIFSKENPTYDDLEVAKRLIKLWMDAGDFSGNKPNIFFDPDEFENRSEGLKEETDKFIKWRDLAESYNSKLIFHQNKRITEEIKKTFGEKTEVDFDKKQKDVNPVAAQVLDISEIDDVRLQVTHTWVGRADMAAEQEANKIFKEIDELVAKASLKDFDLFMQRFSNTDNRKTGDSVFRFSQTYFDKIRTLKDIRDVAIKTGSVAKIVNANRRYIEALQENTIVFDARILFYDAELWDGKEPTEKEKEAHIAMLKSHLGEKGYQEFYDFHQKKMEEFKLDRKTYIEYVETKNGEDEKLKKIEIASWELANSPYYFAEVMQKGYDGVVKEGQHVHPSNHYVRPVPKKYKTDRYGKITVADTGYYDSNFAQIEANEDYLNLYNYMNDLMKKLKGFLPTEKISFMQLNSIPWLKKQMMETIHEGKITDGLQYAGETLVEAVRTDDLATVTDDPNHKQIQLQYLVDIEPRVKQHIHIKTVQMLANDGRAPTDTEKIEWRKSFIDKVVREEKSFELDKVMKAFASTVLTYKHRSLIENQITTMRDIIGRTKQQQTNAAGDQQTDRNLNPHTSPEDMQRLKDMYESYLDTAFWGYPSNKPEGQIKSARVLTKEEKELKKEIEDAMSKLETLLEKKLVTEAEYAGQMAVFNEQINQIGGVHTVSKYGDILLKYVQLKGLGWNAVAGFANLGFGFVSNLMEAADGRNISEKSYWKALGLTLNSVGRNFSFNKWDGLNDNGKKIRILMNYFDTLKQSKDEIYNPSKTSLFRKVGDKIEFLNPFAISSRTEYFNQAPIMIAKLMDTMVDMKTADGTKKISLWEAFNVDGTLKEGVVVDPVFIADVKINIDKIIKFTHGNYDPKSPISFKKTWIGRAMSMFRTWAFEGFSERVMDEMTDHQLQNIKTGENYVKRRGRYRTYLRYYKDHGFQGIFAMTYQLLRKITFQKTTFDKDVKEGGFDSVDAANMRKNMVEIVFYGILTGLVLLLKADMDDDDDPKKKAVYYFLINQIGRINTDIMFYSSPLAFEKLTRNAIPAFTAVIDANKVINDAWIIILGGEDILQSGPNKGESRLFRDIQKIIPGPIQYQKIKSITSREYNTKSVQPS